MSSSDSGLLLKVIRKCFYVDIVCISFLIDYYVTNLSHAGFIQITDFLEIFKCLGVSMFCAVSIHCYSSGCVARSLRVVGVIVVDQVVAGELLA